MSGKSGGEYPITFIIIIFFYLLNWLAEWAWAFLDVNLVQIIPERNAKFRPLLHKSL